MGLAAFLSALAVGGTAGLLSTVHCAAMCGPVAAFTAAGGRVDGHGGRARVGAWLLGRAVAYAGAGALAGTAGLALESLLPVRVAQAVVSLALALALGALGLRLLGWSAALAPPPSAPPAASGSSPPAGAPARLVPLGRPRGRWVWRLLCAAHERPFLLGAAMALIPCGALLAALATAALPGTPSAGALTMTAFAATSSAGLVLSGVLGDLGGALDALTRRALGAVLVVGALVLCLRPWWTLDATSAESACHAEPGVHSGP